MPISRTTELEAVNTMLATIGESPINSFEGEQAVDAVMARNTLKEVLKAVLARGWHFNTEPDVDLIRDEDNKIPLGGDVISVEVSRVTYWNIDVIQMGDHLYDRLNHTDEFEQDLKGTVVYLREFDELPEAMRRYITIRAARVFQDRYPGDANTHRFNEADEMRAEADCKKMEAKVAQPNIFDSISTSRPLRRYW